jgi:hypothetical protein
LTDQGILHDLKVKHDIEDPSNKLLLSIAMTVAEEHHIALGRQEKRRKELLLGWLNEHFNFYDVGTLVLHPTQRTTTWTLQAIATQKESTPATAAGGADPKR